MSIDEVKEFKLPVEVSIAETLVNALEVKEFKLPVEVSKFPNLIFWLESVVAIEELKVEYPVTSGKLTCNEPDITPSVFNLFFIVVLIDEVNEFNDPVLVSTVSKRPSKSLVVVAIEDDKLPILELSEELKVE